MGAVVRKLRNKAGLSQEAFGRVIGMDRSNVSRFENGDQGIDYDKLLALPKVLGEKLSDLFRCAETGGNIEEGPDLRGIVPLISWVQAGDWQTVIDNLVPGQGERISTYRPQQHTYALRVRGDSMEPKFPDGCVIIVEPDAPAEPGSYIIVRQNGDEATFKQLMHDGGRRYLKPLNPRYPILELLPDAVFCGVVKHIQMDV